MSRWFRHYSGMMRDEKLVAVAVRAKQPVERVLWVWGAILESASEIDDGGRYEFDAAEAAYFLRSGEDDIRAIEDALGNAGRVDSGVVVKWGDRQFQSDKSTSRQAAYRERKRVGGGCGDGGQGECDGGVTSPRRHVTPPDTDTDTEEKNYVVSAGAETSISANSKPKPRPKTTKPGYSPEFETFWTGFPAREGTSKAEAWVEWVRLPPDDQNAATGALSAFTAWVKKQGPDYRCVHACRYLKHRRWEGFAISATTPAAQQVPVLEGSPAFRAWERARGKSIPVTDLKDPATGRVLGRGWWFESEYPVEMVAA